MASSDIANAVSDDEQTPSKGNMMNTRPTTLIQVNFDDADDDNFNNAEVDNLDFVTPTSVLLVPMPIMTNSTHSNASTNNTDICILETHESHYAMERNQQLDDSASTIDAPDFTVLNAPTPSPAPPSTIETTPSSATTPPPIGPPPPPYQKRHSDSCACDESTEVLLLHSAECNGKSTNLGGGNGHAFSGTDSDVEVLMSEEIIDSDWSAGAGTLDEYVRTPPDEQINRGNFTNSAQIITAAQKHNTMGTQRSGSLASVKRQESTDQDISVEEFSSQSESLSACEQLPRAQLLNVIREQAVHIRHLEATVQRYRKAQRTLFEHVEALRMALETDTDSEVVAGIERAHSRSHEMIN